VPRVSIVGCVSPLSLDAEREHGRAIRAVKSTTRGEGRAAAHVRPRVWGGDPRSAGRRGRLRLATNRGLQIANVLLRLRQERRERLGDIGHAELFRFADSVAVALELCSLEVEVEL